MYGGAQLKFCTDARIGIARADGSCCTREQNAKIQQYFDWLVDPAFNVGINTVCRDAARRAACAYCHPFSAHLHSDGTVNEKGYPMHPLLCPAKTVSNDWLSACVGNLAPDSRLLTNLQPQNEIVDEYCFPFPVSKYWATPNYTELGLIPPKEAYSFSAAGGTPLPAAVVGAYMVPGTNTWWGLAQSGQIIAWDNVPSTNSWSLVMDIPQVRYKGAGSEGLLGIAFHPKWARVAGRKQFWIYYSVTTDPVLDTRASRISRFDYGAAANPTSEALLATEKVLLQFDQPFTSHKGGRLLFGRDHKMYATSGDGGSENDPESNAQNTSSPLGKVLRLNVLHDYSATDLGLAPRDAVNVGGPGYGPLVYAYGLRSPASFSMDRNGDMWVGNVGQAEREMMFHVTPKANFRWRTLEGSRCNTDVPGVDESVCAALAALPEAKGPALEYCHDNTAPGCPLTEYCESGSYVAGSTVCADTFSGSAIIVGQRYRGQKYPRLRGHFIYVDYRSTAISMARMTDGVDPTILGVTRLSAVGKATASIIEDSSGELYFVSHSYTLNSLVYALSCGSEWCCTEDPVTYPDVPACISDLPAPTPGPATGTRAPRPPRSPRPSRMPTSASTPVVLTLLPTTKPTTADAPPVTPSTDKPAAAPAVTPAPTAAPVPAATPKPSPPPSPVTLPPAAVPKPTPPVFAVTPTRPTQTPTAADKAPVPQPVVPQPVCAELYMQCGGEGFHGPTCCKDTAKCHFVNPWYSQCLVVQN